MSKIKLPNTSGLDTLRINDNFQKIEDELNEKVLYRDNPSGEPNEMHNDLDMNGKRIYNLPKPESEHEPIRRKDVLDAVNATEDARDAANRANSAADRAEQMEEDFQRFLINSGYQHIGNYEAGLNITARNQIFRRDGELYRAGAALELPYTTTGDWAMEEVLFVGVGDHSLRQELAGDNGTAMVFNNSGLQGEVSRSLYEIMRDSKSIKDFGAVGDYDGVYGTNNYEALTAAFNSGVKSIYVPGEVFFVDNSSDFVGISTEGLTIYGPGEIVFSNSTKEGLRIAAPNVSVLDITITGIGNPDPGYIGPSKGTLNAYRPGLLSCVGVDESDQVRVMNATVDGVTVNNPGVTGIAFYKASGFSVRNSRVTSNYPISNLTMKSNFFCISAYTCSDFDITNNEVHGACQGLHFGALGVSFDFTDKSGEVGHTCRNFVVTGNRATGVYDHALYTSNDCSDYIVSNNFLYGASSSEDGAGAGSLKLEGNDFVASGNVARDGIILRNCFRCNISHNIVPIHSGIGSGANLNSKYGILHEEVIFKRTTDSISIVGNTIYVVGEIQTTGGIYIAGKVYDGFQSIISNLNISDNTIRDFGFTSANGFGIFVRQELLENGGTIIDVPARNVNISNNVIRMSSVGDGPVDYGIHLAGSFLGGSVSGNTISNLKGIGVNSLGVKEFVFEGNQIYYAPGTTNAFGFYERIDNTLTLHAISQNNLYGHNQIQGGAIRYFIAHESTRIADRIPILVVSQPTNFTTNAYSNAEVIIWSPSSSGLVFTLSTDLPWPTGYQLTVINQGTQSFLIQNINYSLEANSSVRILHLGGGSFALV